MKNELTITGFARLVGIKFQEVGTRQNPNFIIYYALIVVYVIIQLMKPRFRPMKALAV